MKLIPDTAAAELSDEPDRAEGDTLWVQDELQVRLAKSPRRHDIVDRLAAAGPLSVRELARTIGAHPAALYHHIRQLQEAGLVVEAGHRVVRRRREQLYATVSRRIRLGAALEDPANDQVMSEIATGLTRQMDRDFKAGLNSPDRRPSGPHRTLGFLRLVGTPSPRTLKQVNAKLEEITELLWRDQSQTHPPVAFHWLMAPLSQSAPESEPD